MTTPDPAAPGDAGSAYPVSLEGPRLLLREFREDDLDDCMAVVGDEDVTWSLSFDTRSKDQQAALLAADITRAQLVPRPDYYLAVVDRASTSMIGFARLGLARPGTAEIGTAIRKDMWRHGFATEASVIILDFGFDTLGLHRIQAACGPDNVVSQMILAKLGFRPEGRMRDHVFTNGAWRDSLLYSLLDNEWRVSRGSFRSSATDSPDP